MFPAERKKASFPRSLQCVLLTVLKFDHVTKNGNASVILDNGNALAIILLNLGDENA